MGKVCTRAKWSIQPELLPLDEMPLHRALHRHKHKRGAIRRLRPPLSREGRRSYIVNNWLSIHRTIIKSLSETTQTLGKYFLMNRSPLIKRTNHSKTTSLEPHSRLILLFKNVFAQGRGRTRSCSQVFQCTDFPEFLELLKF